MLDHVVETLGKSRSNLFYRVELSQLGVHVSGSGEFGPFSRGLTRGLVQAVKRLGCEFLSREVAWWLEMACLLCTVFSDVQSDHICSKA